MRRSAIIVFSVLTVISTMLFSVISEDIVSIPAIIDVVSIEQRLKVELVENASTGYTWSYEVSDPSFLTLVSKETAESSVDTPVIAGSPSTVTWLFSPNKSGSFSLVFRLFRAWEGEETAIDVRVYNVEVQNSSLSECVPQYVTILGSSSGEIEISQLARIVLQENPSTGYSWKAEVFDAAVLRTVERSLLAESDSHEATPIVELGGSQEVLGAPVNVAFDFEALKAGISLVRFTYSRPWEESEQDKTLLVGIKVAR
ncbi:MAG TPA: protease inhibitor I42 family protein [Mesotoga sp.]|jgi:inhibitor of cysteine peptidase|nr:protease inhibitor I42 family protein [Mesotoga sp.]MDI9375251.1 protease inhibitor I42 family protein [Thermotogota bacterium]NLX34011.1 protease inhibitor I42 family protein [Thermotogaceae bacterium]MDD4041216.1 protease inhibitor I42 family protein [Mesotoga sp.]MDD4478047.1 protease inhibitor I42 family protein [Mesotoga sp.]